MHTVPWLTLEHTPVHTHTTATPRCEREQSKTRDDRSDEKRISTHESMRTFGEIS